MVKSLQLQIRIVCGVRAINTFTNNCTEKNLKLFGYLIHVELIWHLGFYLTFQEKYSDCQCDKLNFKMKS
jgi:hypothetical protein